MQLCLWPSLRLAGFPKTRGTSALAQRCLNPFLEDRLQLEAQEDGSLRQLAFCPELHICQKPTSSSWCFDNGFQVLWHQRSLLGSSKNHRRKWKQRNALLRVGGCFHLLKGLLPSAAYKTSPQDLAHRTEQLRSVHSVLKYFVFCFRNTHSLRYSHAT